MVLVQLMDRMSGGGDARGTASPPRVSVVTAASTFPWEDRMIKWAIIFFVISLIAGFFGFTDVAKGAKTISKWLFFIALAIFLIVLIFGVMLGQLVF